MNSVKPIAISALRLTSVVASPHWNAMTDGNESPDENKLAVVKEEKVGNRQRLAEVVTASRGPGVPGTAKIRVFWNGHVYGGIEFEDADALFVTQSAIEKFLLPYYMRFKSGAQVQALENMLFNDRAVVAAYHIRPSVPKAFPEPPTIGCVKPKAGSDEFTVGVL